MLCPMYINIIVYCTDKSTIEQSQCSLFMGELVKCGIWNTEYKKYQIKGITSYLRFLLHLDPKKKMKPLPFLLEKVELIAVWR